MANPTRAIIGANHKLSTIKANSHYLSRPFIWFGATTTNCAFCINHIDLSTLGIIIINLIMKKANIDNPSQKLK